MANPYSHGDFSWVDLNSKNMMEARDFYASVFGWHCVDQDTQGGPPYSIFELDGKQVAGMGQMSPEMIDQGVPSVWNNYVQVSNCETVCAKCEELGGAVFMPSMKVLDAGTMAFLQDPHGAMFAIWEADQHFGSEIKDEMNSFCWNELATRDFDGAKSFYGGLFGWSFEANPDSPAQYNFILNGEAQNGGIMLMDENWGDVPPNWTVYFKVANVDESAEKIKSHGGQICHGPFDGSPTLRIAICGDLHGGMFNLIQFKQENASG